MKILMVAPTPYFSHRGCHVRIYEEIQALEELGHQVTLCTYFLGDSVPGQKICRIPRIIPWYNKTEAGPSIWKFLLDIRLALLVRGQLRSGTYEIIHAHLHEGVAVTRLATVGVKKLPIIFDYQGSLSEELHNHRFISQSSFLGRAVHVLESWLEKQADTIVVSSKHFLDNINLHTTQTVEVVGDAVSLKQIKNKTPKKDLRQQLGIPDSATIVGFVGLLNSYQGVDILLEAFTRVIKRHPKVMLLCMGYPNVELYKQKAETLGIGDKVVFTGKVDYFQLYEYLDLFDIAVSPKLVTTEANGKLLNYLEASIPTVVFDLPMNHNILGEAALYVKGQSALELADGLVELLTHTKKQRFLREKMDQRLLEIPTWKDNAKRLESIYESLTQ